MTNETKHTPGPWRIGAPYGRLQTEIVNEHGIRSIATVWTGYYKDKQMPAAEILPYPEGQANAVLIAAAPEMAAERDHLREINATLLDEREALRKALEPFAKHLPHDPRIASKTDHPIKITVRLKDIKAARAAFAQAKEEQL